MSKTVRVQKWAATILPAFLLAAIAFGQVTVGRISGVVTDQSGAVVGGAIVTLSEPRSGVTTQATTTDNGSYVFSSVAPGTYIVTVEKPGFATRREENVVLDAASSRTVNFAISPGAVSETISVVGTEEQIKTDSGDVASTLDNRKIDQIAMNGRNYFTLMNLLPGVTTSTLDPVAVGVNTTGTFINGSRSPSTGVYVDGINNLSIDQNTYQLVVPNPDTIDQVKVVTASYAAEYGGNAGAMVTIITKSGTKQFHGSLFEYLRNDKFDARSFLATVKEPLHLNDFGATIGGPVYIPKKWNTDRNKLFFFGGFEQKYYHFQTAAVSLVPTALERAGNFTQSSVKPIDPSTGAPFSSAIVPANVWSKNGPKQLAAYPLPNYTSAAGNFVRNPLTAQEPLEEQVKLDYLVSNNTRISTSAARETWFTWNDGGALGIQPNVNGGGSQPGWLTGLNATTTITPRLLNYASFNVAAEHFQHAIPTPTLSRDALGITYPELSPVNQYNTAPKIVLSGLTGYGPGDPGAGKGQISFDFNDAVTYVKGSHVLKAGAHFLRARDNENSCGCGNENGTVTYNTSASRTTGSVIADALLGNFYQYTEDLYGEFAWIRFSVFELYAQDSWNVNKHLHLDYGVRWSYNQLPYSVVGNESVFLPSLYNQAQAVTVNRQTGAIVSGSGSVYNGLALLGSGFSDYPYASRIPAAAGNLSQYGSLFHGLPKSVWDSPKTNFAPRFGFAYDPKANGKTAIRGGFGMFYDRPAANIYLLNMALNPPLDYSYSVFNGNIDNPSAAAGTTFPSALSTVSPNFKTPYMMTYNLNIQHQLPGKIILDVGYVGTLGRHLSRGININQLPVGTLTQAQNKGVNANALRPYLGYGNIIEYDYGDNSNYNALQTSANRRMGSGFSFGSSFTWSKALDALPQQTAYTPTTVQNAYNARADYGLSGVNRKFVFSVNAQYEVPFAKQSTNAFYRGVAGGWTISGVFFAQSGAPLNVTVTPDVAGIGTAGSRASLGPNANLYLDDPTPTKWFNTAAFLPVAQMTQGQFGNAGRNILVGPAFNQLDVALFKHFKIGERLDFEFRAESYNLPNHPSFTALGTVVGTSTFGAVTGTGNPRIDQFALKLHF